MNADRAHLCLQLTKEFAPKSLVDSISIQEFSHTWTQSSIVRSSDKVLTCSPHIPVFQIVRINGTSAEDDGVVIIGAHQDRCVFS